MIGLQERSRAPELMDVEQVDLATFAACLRDLEWINRWTGAYRITLQWLERLRQTHGFTRLVLLDVGSGYGDMLRRIEAWGGRRGLDLDLIGVDLNPHAEAAATRATPPGSSVRYRTGDVFDLPADFRPDVVISALFTHHLDDERLIHFLGWMEARSRLGWLINDLHRHVVAYRIARRAPGLLRLNRLVRHDASVSVARAFTRAEWTRLLEAAGLAGPPTTVTWHFPFRYAVDRIKPG